MRRRPSNVYRIAHTGNVAAAMSGYQVQKCSYNYMRANRRVRRRVVAGGTGEDKMAEIAMAHGRGETGASGLTMVGYVAQGQR
jgi:hypothetical protein